MQPYPPDQQPSQPLYPAQPPQVPPPPPTGSYAPTMPGQTPPPPPPPPMYNTPGQMPSWQGAPMQPRPNGLRRFFTWYRRQTRPMQIIVALLILGAVIFVLSAGISGAVQSATETANADATATVQAQNQPTTAPATPTEIPTPTATPTTAQRIAQIVKDNATLDDKVETKVTTDAVIVTETLSLAWDNTAYRNAMQFNCFDIQKALWHSGIKHLKDIEINFLGPVVDAYGNKSTGAMGLCELLAPTAAKFNWDNLDAQQAWAVYDNAIFASAVQG